MVRAAGAETDGSSHREATSNTHISVQSDILAQHFFALVVATTITISTVQKISTIIWLEKSRTYSSSENLYDHIEIDPYHLLLLWKQSLSSLTCQDALILLRGHWTRGRVTRSTDSFTKNRDSRYHLISLYAPICHPLCSWCRTKTRINGSWILFEYNIQCSRQWETSEHMVEFFIKVFGFRGSASSTLAYLNVDQAVRPTSSHSLPCHSHSYILSFAALKGSTNIMFCRPSIMNASRPFGEARKACEHFRMTAPERWSTFLGGHVLWRACQNGEVILARPWGVHLPKWEAYEQKI